MLPLVQIYIFYGTYSVTQFILLNRISEQTKKCTEIKHMLNSIPFPPLKISISIDC